MRLVPILLTALLLANCGDALEQPAREVKEQPNDSGPKQDTPRGHAETQELFLSIDKAISKWRAGEGKPESSFPRTGKNTLEDKYAGNMKLFRALVARPQSKGKDPYIDIDDEMIGYLGKDGSISETGPESRALFLDAWGSPIVYWEWKSRTDDLTDPSDPTGGGRTYLITPEEETLARNKSGYDLYSAGKDKVLGTKDDLNDRAESATDSPFSKRMK